MKKTSTSLCCFGYHCYNLQIVTLRTNLFEYYSISHWCQAFARKKCIFIFQYNICKYLQAHCTIWGESWLNIAQNDEVGLSEWSGELRLIRGKKKSSISPGHAYWITKQSITPSSGLLLDSIFSFSCSFWSSQYESTSLICLDFLPIRQKMPPWLTEDNDTLSIRCASDRWPFYL